MEMIQYKCPACGAKINGNDNANDIECTYCGTSFIVQGDLNKTLAVTSQSNNVNKDTPELKSEIVMNTTIQNVALFLFSIFLYLIAIVLSLTVIGIVFVYIFCIFGWAKHFSLLSKGNEPEQFFNRKKFNNKCLAIFIFLLSLLISVFYWIAVITGQWAITGDDTYAIPSAIIFTIILVIPSFFILKRTLKNPPDEN